MNVAMDPFGEVTRECHIPPSQEVILRNLMLSVGADSQEFRLGVPSDVDEEDDGLRGHFTSPPTPVMFCSLPDSAAREGTPPPLARQNSPQSITDIADSESSKKPRISKSICPESNEKPDTGENTKNSCITPLGKSLAEGNLRLLENFAEKSRSKGRSVSGLAQTTREKTFKDSGVSMEKGNSSSREICMNGEGTRNSKKPIWGSLIGSKTSVDPDGSNAISVSRIFGRLSGSLSEEGSAEKRVGSLSKCSLVNLSGEDNAENNTLSLSKSLEGNAEKQGVSACKSPATNKDSWGLRKLPSSIQSMQEETVGGKPERSDMPSGKLTLDKLVEIASSYSTQRNGENRDLDCFRTAVLAGYKFPHPRWWPPGDEF